MFPTESASQDRWEAFRHFWQLFSTASECVYVCVFYHFHVHVQQVMWECFLNWTRVCIRIVGPLDSLNSEAPQPRLCNAHTTRSLHPSVCVGVDPLTTCVWWAVSAVRWWCLRHQLSFTMPETICPSWCRYSKPERATSAYSVPNCAELCQVVPRPIWIHQQPDQGAGSHGENKALDEHWRPAGEAAVPPGGWM